MTRAFIQNISVDRRELSTRYTCRKKAEIIFSYCLLQLFLLVIFCPHMAPD